MKEPEYFNTRIDNEKKEVILSESGDEIKFSFEDFISIYKSMTPAYEELVNKEE